MNFQSDNNAPVHPNIIAALSASKDPTDAYGTDAFTQHVCDEIRAVFDAPEAAVYLLGTGTAANALALACLVKPWQGVYCHPLAHINQDECTAPEFFTGGAKLIQIDGDDGRIAPQELHRVLKKMSTKDVHCVQPGALSITNVTERGTIYSPDQTEELCKIAKEHNIKTHLDGARFANAIAALGCAPADISWRAGIDVVSFGGTKNGLMGVEAVVIFNPDLAWEFELRRKRAGHLFSKHRYLAIQMQGYLQDNLWLNLARHANAMGARLAQGFRAYADIELLHPPQANMIFARISDDRHRHLQDAGVRYYASPADEGGQMIRLVCSWSTTQAEIEQCLSYLD